MVVQVRQRWAPKRPGDVFEESASLFEESTSTASTAYRENSSSLSGKHLGSVSTIKGRGVKEIVSGVSSVGSVGSVDGEGIDDEEGGRRLQQLHTLSRLPWTEAEDRRLKELMEVEGTGVWERKAVLFPGRTGRSLRDRWRRQKETEEGIKRPPRVRRTPYQIAFALILLRRTWHG